jgi:hypothetical protein
MKSAINTLAILFVCLPAFALAQATVFAPPPEFVPPIVISPAPPPPEFGTPSFSLSLDAPATIIVGDLMVAEIATKGDTEIIGPAGWSRLGATFDIPVISEEGSDGEPASVAFFTKLAESIDAVNMGVSGYYTFSWTSAGGQPLEVESAGLILVYSGVDQFKPVEALWTGPASAGLVSNPSIRSNVVRNNSRVVELYAAQSSIQTETDPEDELTLLPLNVEASGLTVIEAVSAVEYQGQTYSSEDIDTSVSIGSADFSQDPVNGLVDFTWYLEPQNSRVPATQWVLGALIVNPPWRATYHVTKTFGEDDPPATVTVGLDCDGGDLGYSIQYPSSAQIGPGGEVSFTVEGFNDQNPPDCYVWEYAPGYTPDFDGDGCNNRPAPGMEYYCQIENKYNEVTFNVTKTFADGRSDEVYVWLECDHIEMDSATTIDQKATLYASGFNTGADCKVHEEVPPGMLGSFSPGCDVYSVVNRTTYECEVTNSESVAIFTVYKQFMDGNIETPVTLNIDCNSGLPLQNSITVFPDDGDLLAEHEVKFIVTNFVADQMDCTVWESEVPGYTASYECGHIGSSSVCTDGASSPIDNFGTGPCVYTDVNTRTNLPPAEHQCMIRNYPEIAEVSVVKEWVVSTTGSDEVPQVADITIWCDALILDGDFLSSSGYYYKVFSNVTGNDTVTALVVPDQPESHCWATENIIDDAVEMDSDCGTALAPGMTVSIENDDSCRMTNTVFYEGIPTLSQYGLAIMALLTLGIGLVGFRRYA